VNNCQASAVVTLTQPAAVTASAAITSNYNGQAIKCYGLTNGSALASASGGTGAYTYSWSTSPVQTTASASNLGAGSYTVVVKDVNNCQASAMVTLTQPPAVTVSASVTSNYHGQNISCNGAADGAALATANGGTLPYDYSWSTQPPQLTAAASNMPAGTYTVQVSDVNKCQATAVVTLIQPTALSATAAIVSSYHGQQISCSGATDASVSVTVVNGTGPYTYSWSTSPVQTGSVATGLGAGTYSVVVTDVNGCSITRTVSITAPPVLTSTASIASNYNGEAIRCSGDANGSITVAPSGGTLPYTYLWNTTPAQTSATASNLGAGSYMVTVTDANGCVSTASAVISSPSALTATVIVSSNYNGQQISCFGAADGAALATASGGTGAYTYSWSGTPAQTTAAAVGLSAGSYTVLIHDVNNCLVTRTIQLSDPAQLTSTIVAVSDYHGSNISCHGGSDGWATVSRGGGTAPYFITWSTAPVQNTATALGLGAGLYTVTVKDINNCMVTNSVALVEPSALAYTVAVTSDYNGQQVSCFGATNASITATAANATPPYTYSWSTTPVQTGNVASGLGAGNYQVLITDDNGCSATQSVAVSQPPLVAASTSVTSDYNGVPISCFGLSNGSAVVNPAGGTQPYSYSWSTSPAQTGAAASGLSVGTYSVTVTDVNGCATLVTATLAQPPVLDAQVISVSDFNGYNVSCAGSSNGAINISANGGTGSYTYAWSNASSTQNVSGLAAGNYSVVVSDVNGCTDTLYSILQEPPVLVAALDSLSQHNGYNISCNGGQNGMVYVSVSGGVSSYSYSWSNGASGQDLSGVSAGSYTLVVTDQNNCQSVISASLSQPAALTYASAVSALACHGVPTGSVNATVGGGVEPYTYIWSNGSGTEDLSNVGAGTYTLTFTDANNCSSQGTAVVTQPDSLSLTKQLDNLKCNGDTLGNIFLNPSGGTAPYTYSWSDGSSSKDLNNIPAGVYSVAITDAHGCVFNDTSTITQPASLSVSLTSPTTNGFNISTYQGDDGSIDLSVLGGTSPYSYSWSNGSTDEDLSGLVAGTYSVIVTDVNGCRDVGEIRLTQPLVLEMPQGFSPNGDDKNETFVVHGIEAYPDNTLTIYNRWGNIVYSKSGYNNEWAGGNTNGQDLPAATYFAILEINGGKIVLKGYVELRR